MIRSGMIQKSKRILELFASINLHAFRIYILPFRIHILTGYACLQNLMPIGFSWVHNSILSGSVTNPSLKQNGGKGI